MSTRCRSCVRGTGYGRYHVAEEAYELQSPEGPGIPRGTYTQPIFLPARIALQ